MISRRALLPLLSTAILAAAGGAWIAVAQNPAQPTRTERFLKMSGDAEARGLAEPFKGITTNGTPMRGLFSLRSTGVSTAPVRMAADKWLASLTAEQRTQASYGVDDPEWRKWMNQHFYVRQGVSFEAMSLAQREAAFDLLRASLSARGLTLTRDIMKLNHTLGELNNNDFEQYGEWLYFITVMGKPSDTEPWGWQLDGHHAIINYFVIGDQVVMTPTFVGSEPVIAESGKYKGTAILQSEQRQGLVFLRSLTRAQRAKAIVSVSKDGNNNIGEAFKDNVVLDYAGLRAADLSASQRADLLSLVAAYVGNMDDGHARVKMTEVQAHLDDTHFAWIGSTDDTGVFYYRIHSPVILIEFDHQRPAGLRHLYPADRPMQQHVHVVMRTPNGNDYGKDLLRQHYEAHQHDPSHGHAH
jgi:hypothetical protein